MNDKIEYYHINPNSIFKEIFKKLHLPDEFFLIICKYLGLSELIMLKGVFKKRYIDEFLTEIARKESISRTWDILANQINIWIKYGIEECFCTDYFEGRSCVSQYGYCCSTLFRKCNDISYFDNKIFLYSDYVKRKTEIVRNDIINNNFFSKNKLSNLIKDINKIVKLVNITHGFKYSNIISRPFNLQLISEEINISIKKKIEKKRYTQKKKLFEELNDFLLRPENLKFFKWKIPSYKYFNN